MGRRLYVGNLPYTTGEAELQELFSRAGNVESVRVMRDAATGRARGFAFVEMSTDEEAAKAASEFNQYQMGGRSLTVNEARPKPASAGGFGGGESRRRFASERASSDTCFVIGGATMSSTPAAFRTSRSSRRESPKPRAVRRWWRTGSRSGRRVTGDGAGFEAVRLQRRSDVAEPGPRQRRDLHRAGPGDRRGDPVAQPTRARDRDRRRRSRRLHPPSTRS